MKSSYTALIYRLKKDFEKEMMIEVCQNIEEVQYLPNNFAKQMNSMEKEKVENSGHIKAIATGTPFWLKYRVLLTDNQKYSKFLCFRKIILTIGQRMQDKSQKSVKKLLDHLLKSVVVRAQTCSNNEIGVDARDTGDSINRTWQLA